VITGRITDDRKVKVNFDSKLLVVFVCSNLTGSRITDDGYETFTVTAGAILVWQEGRVVLRKGFAPGVYKLGTDRSGYIFNLS